jgi:hypothetical protein
MTKPYTVVAEGFDENGHVVYQEIRVGDATVYRERIGIRWHERIVVPPPRTGAHGEIPDRWTRL